MNRSITKVVRTDVVRYFALDEYIVIAQRTKHKVEIIKDIPNTLSYIDRLITDPIKGPFAHNRSNMARLLARLLVAIFVVFWVDLRLGFWLGFDWLLVGFEFF